VRPPPPPAGPRDTGAGWDTFPGPCPAPSRQAGLCAPGPWGRLPQHGSGTRGATGQGAAHRAEEGCSGVVAVGVLVPQHEVMRSVDDDTLEVREGVEQPGAQPE